MSEQINCLIQNNYLLRSARKKSIQSVADDDELLNAKPELAVNVGKTSMLRSSI